MNSVQTKHYFLQDTALFFGMYPAEIDYICSLLQMQVRTYPKNMTIIREGDIVPRFGLVAEGTVQVSMTDINGNNMVMANVQQGTTFAEALACTGTAESPIRAEAIQNSAVFWFQAFLLNDPDWRSDIIFNKFCINFMQVLARRGLAFNDRIQVLSKRTIREKLITYFSQQSVQQKTSEIAIEFDRKGLADYLGVERSALSRELSNMRRDGLVDFRKNKFILHSGEDDKM